MARKTIEPFLWTLFSAGGVVAALFIPIHVLLFGLAFPLGWLDAPSYGEILPYHWGRRVWVCLKGYVLHPSPPCLPA